MKKGKEKYPEELLNLVKKCKSLKCVANYSPKKKNKLGILLYNQTNFLSNTIGIRERLWYIENNLFEPTKCDNCDNIPTWDWRRLKYKKYCPKCVHKSPEWLTKFKYTKLNRYGNENYCNMSKVKQTNLKKYGVEYISQYDKFKEKAKKTNLKKYNNENYKNIKKQNKTKLEIYHKRFLEISKEIHNNRYRYFELKRSHDLINIECPIHGIFRQTMHVHMRGANCPKCANSGFSKKAINWLNHISKTKGLYIQHAMNKGEYQIPETNYKVDGYCSENSTVYEFLGDIWHGNPRLFKECQVVHPYKNISVKECHNQTMSRLQKIKSLGYSVEYIWEYDYDHSGFMNK